MRRLTVVLLLTAVFALFEFVGAYLSRSLSLRSDAIHMAGDVSGIGLAWLFAAVVRHKEASERKRAESLGAYTSALLLASVSLLLIASSFLRFFTPYAVESRIMLLVATGGLVVNVIGLLLLYGEQRQNLNTKGAYRHIQSDAIASVGVVIGALAIKLTGQTVIDLVLGAMIAVLILWSAGGLLKESWAALIELSHSDGVFPEHFVAALIERMRIPGVQEIHDVTITSNHGFAQVRMHVVMANSHGSTKILGKVRSHLRSMGIRPVLVVCHGQRRGKCQVGVSS